MFNKIKNNISCPLQLTTDNINKLAKIYLHL